MLSAMKYRYVSRKWRFDLNGSKATSRTHPRETLEDPVYQSTIQSNVQTGCSGADSPSDP